MSSEPTILRLGPDCPEVEVLYEDQEMLALNKPAGIPVAPDRWDKNKANLVSLLNSAIAAKKKWAVDGGYTHLTNAHQLDVGTSGVLLLARTSESLTRLTRLFQNHKILKTYTAIVTGHPPEREMEVNRGIGMHPRIEGLSALNDQHGKPAITMIRVLEQFRDHALVEARPMTSRRHQVRVHLKAIGCPIIGDPDYSGVPLLLSELHRHYKLKPEGERPLVGRPALHASELVVPTSDGNSAVTVTAPLPKDMTVGLKYLRKFSA